MSALRLACQVSCKSWCITQNSLHPFFGRGFLSFASGMVRINTDSLRCLSASSSRGWFGRIEPNAKIPKATHLFTRAQHGCALSVIITHPRVIIFTLRSTIERVWECKTPTQTPVAPNSAVYMDIMRMLCVFTTGASYRDTPPKPSRYEKFTVSPYHCITGVIIV